MHESRGLGDVYKRQVEEGIYDYENCVECHRSGDEDEAERIWRSKRFGSGNLRSVDRYRYDEDRHEHDDDD